ncbi:hypothetical protein GEMRC1_006341 [Eukaryota sp. GEM-RC1]
MGLRGWDLHPILLSSQMMLSSSTLQSTLEKRRWIVFVAFVVFQICLGINYSLPSVIPFLVDAGWTSSTAQFTWAVATFMIGLSCIASGIIVRRLSYRFLTVCSFFLLLIGYNLASLKDGTNFYIVFIGISIICSSGVGLSYLVAIRVSTSYFPKNKGLITGFAVGVFGSGSILWSFIAEAFLTNGHPPGRVFQIFGLSAPFGVLLAGLFMVPARDVEAKQVDNEDEQIEEKHEDVHENVAEGVGHVSNQELIVIDGDHTMTESNSDCQSARISKSDVEVITEITVDVPQKPIILMTLKMMFAEWKFWLIFIIMIIATSSGFMFIGALRLFPQPYLEESGYSSEEITRFTFLSAAFGFNIGNGLGRILFGRVVDSIGASATLILAVGCQCVCILAFVWLLCLSCYSNFIVVCHFITLW